MSSGRKVVMSSSRRVEVDAAHGDGDHLARRTPTTASRIVSNESYFPVPVIRRERNSRPAIVRLSTSAPFAGMTQIRFCGRGLVAASQPPFRDSRVRPPMLAPLKLRGPLLGEGGHALLLVLRREQLGEEPRLGLEVLARGRPGARGCTPPSRPRARAGPSRRAPRASSRTFAMSSSGGCTASTSPWASASSAPTMRPGVARGPWRTRASSRARGAACRPSRG